MSGRRKDSIVHSVQLGSRRSDLLDSELTELGLELAELLEEILLVLGPKGPGLDFGRLRRRYCQYV